MFQPPPPLPPPSGLRRLRMGGVWVLVAMLWVAAAPSVLPAGAAGQALALAGQPSDEEAARLRHQAWLRGREATADAQRARKAARQAAAGSGATSGAGAAGPPVGGDRAIPAMALRAYREAAAWASGFDPRCGLTWPVLAGIGRIESNHGMFGGARFSASGAVSPRITGLPLDGRGVARIADSDGGRWDGDTVWDRAVGPMQFIPTTWRSLGRDGNGDGVADPNNLFDSAVSAAAYLCLSVDGSLSDPAVLRQALYNYNHSWSYVDAVLGWARLYEGGVTAGPNLAAGRAGAPGTTAAARAPATTKASSTSRASSTTKASSTTRRATTTTRRPTTTTRPSTTGSSTSTTRPCESTTTTTSSSSSTTTTTTTTTTLPGSTTTSTTLPPCE